MMTKTKICFLILFIGFGLSLSAQTDSTPFSPLAFDEERLSESGEIAIAAGSSVGISVPRPFAKTFSIVCDENVETVRIAFGHTENVAGNNEVILKYYSRGFATSWQETHLEKFEVRNEGTKDCECIYYLSNELDNAKY